MNWSNPQVENGDAGKKTKLTVAWFDVLLNHAETKIFYFVLS
jgi:hypothetical protein